MPPSAKPFSLNSDPARPDFRVPDLDFYPGTAADRIDRRREYLAVLDRLSRDADESGKSPPKQFEQAYRLLTSPGAKRASNRLRSARAVKRWSFSI